MYSSWKTDKVVLVNKNPFDKSTTSISYRETEQLQIIDQKDSILKCH